MSKEHIIRKTLGELRSFLDEMVNETSRYRSLHNLTEQVEHQYHDRFLVELLQNAHDALLSETSAKHPQRVAIAYEEEGEFGSLYVANDGRPLSASNFKAISNLGQSDKNPQESIGNKGIGFRSVLEITTEPYIYSRQSSDSDYFDGYCFRFDPKIICVLGTAIGKLANGVSEVAFPVDDRELLCTWEEAKVAEFNSRFGGENADGLVEELGYLSPYVMPIPVELDEFTPKVLEFQRQGFSTVVRLPLRNSSAQAAVKRRLSELEAKSILFLDKLDSLSLEAEGKVRNFFKSRRPIDQDPFSGVELRVDEVDGDCSPVKGHCFWVWQRTIGGAGNEEERSRIQEAVAELPGSWHQVEQATVAVALQKDSGSAPGMLNIYLPTRVPTGCAAHFSGPFHGDMSRTTVDFSNPFNKLLIDTIAELSVDIVFESLVGRGQHEFDAILDLVARSNTDEGREWFEALSSVLIQRGIELQSADILLTGDDWNSPDMSSLLPRVEAAEVITEDVLRQHATFPVVNVSSSDATKQLQALYDSLGISVAPLDDDIANTLEQIAADLHKAGAKASWNGFWKDTGKLLKNKPQPLLSKNVLLGTDGQLHSVGDGSSVFFQPRTSGDDEEVRQDFDVTDIPGRLRNSVAFLSEAIEVQVPGERGGIRNTPVHSFLSQGLVETYGIERIFSSVLVKAVPELPISFGAADSDLCREILHWGLRLLAAAKGDQEQAIRLLGQLPVPCRGGWFPLNQTSFGSGWHGKSGENLEDYLTTVGTPACAAAHKKVLLPPDSLLWGSLGGTSIRLLVAAGVFSGLRLTVIKPNTWASKLWVSMASGVQLPLQGPKSIENEIWSSYREYVAQSSAPMFMKAFQYEMGALHSLPGLESWSAMEATARERFMQLLLVSMPNWDKVVPSWQVTRLRKIGGTSHTLTPASFLMFFLQTVEWLQGVFNEEAVEFAPSERWYIPAFSRLGGIHQYSHLHPMPLEISSVIDSDPSIAEVMTELGMPTYQGPEVETRSTRLLEDLAGALNDPENYISNTNVFLGQVRDAWAQFNPFEDEGPLEYVVISEGAGNLRVVSPAVEQPVYIPDTTHQIHRGLEAHAKPLLAIEPRDARRMEAYFSQAYGERIRFASHLEQLALVDGEEWVEVGNETLLSEECPWLITLVLATVAFTGSQSRGTGTKRFTEVLDVLRSVRICWVKQLDTCWRYNGFIETQLDAQALISGKSPTILALAGVQSDLSGLADVLSVVVGRGDIDISLKLLLSERELFGEYSDDELCQALNKLNIARDELEQVQHRWIGDFAWQIRLWRPLVLILEPDAFLEELESATNPEELFAAISNLGFSSEQLEQMTGLVNSSSGFKTLGQGANELLGDVAELGAWNSALERCGEAVVKNDEVVEDFRGVIESLRLIFRQFSRALVIRAGGEIAFDTVYHQISSIKCPTNYSERYWTLPFSGVMSVVVQSLSTLDVDESLLEAVAAASSLPDLRERLSKLDIDVVTDPLEVQAKNQRLLSTTIERLRSVAIAWATRRDIDAGFWAQERAAIEGKLVQELSQRAYIQVWQASDCVAMLSALKPAGISSEIWDAIEEFSAIDKMMEKLGVSPADIAEASKVMEHYREAETRRKNAVEVCGSEFTNTSDNLGTLMEHISGLVSLDSLELLDATHPGDLEAQTRKGKPKPTKSTPGPGGGQKSKGRMSQAMKDLVGLAGEIHAYRLLESKYGKEVVSPSSWKSENSRHSFPGNAASDDYGCDIEIVVDGKTYYYEVKASQSDDESFEMGSSEIRLALGCAKGWKRQFRIIHVLNALTDSPILRILPNPYDSKQQDRYRFEEAGLRVRYHLAD
ncbi:DUF3883 domain-containing protein [Mangrovimicrobium sediminis]|uniref:DUF3883 domain-containing protein n=1 Tax=Mangrovimicrobium sediminis TaxID=2562682 RepID=A0A4Z0LYG9_9GAMM|nr:DUF3883 domain-containing protein [Haliea sp. SAOS-164]TGD72178.1 DUF3883 domain-containing protein [Haliea sp. SAOS-164]